MLKQHKLITNRSIISSHKRPLERSSIEDSELAESVMRLVENSGNVRDSLICRQRAVGFDVASHAVDDVRHGDAGIGIVGVVVKDGGFVYGAVCA